MAKTSKHILMICVSSQGVINFRSGLIKKLISAGQKVSVIAFDNKFQNDVESLGCDFYVINDNNRSTSPIKILTLKNKYVKLIETIKPDVVFTFMLKPNIFGVLASKKMKVKAIYSMVEGVGDAFIMSSIKWKVIRFVIRILYKRSFKYVDKVFFLNDDDKNDFINMKLVTHEKCIIINGIGVNLEKFSYSECVNKHSFLMVARMLKTKGIYEYCECARRIKKIFPEVEFKYLGAEGNVSIHDIQEYINDGSIKYLGTTKDVRPYLNECSALILPSYREGVPMSIMEALAIGRPIITTDVPGCKETVIDGYNGYLVEKGNVDQLVEKVKYIIENTDIYTVFGYNSRVYAENKFDQNKINNQIIEVIL